MFKINKKRKILLLSILLTLLITVITSIAYLIVYLNTSQREIEFRLLKEAEEIVSQHILVDAERVVFNKDGNNLTIESDLVSDGFSAVIYNKDGDIIGKFGIADTFEYPTSEFNLDDYNDTIKRTIETGDFNYIGRLKFTESHNIFSISYPIIVNNISYGAILVISPNNTWYTSLSITVINLLAVFPISFLLSILTSNIISKFSFQEIEHIIEKMKNITTNRLNDYIDENNYQDEMLALVKTYNKMLYRLKNSFEKQKHFISNTSHELKTPITKIINRLELLKLNRKTYTAKDLDIVVTELLELNNIIDTLLSFAKTDELQKFEIRTVNIHKVMEGTVDKYSKEILDKKLKVENKINRSLDIETIPSYFQIVLQNLFSNAVKYSNFGGFIKLYSINNKNKISIVFQDFGIGIESRDINKLKNRFYRTQNSKNAGFGLGLSIVYDICKELGYKITLESALNQGTKVVLTLK